MHLRNADHAVSSEQSLFHTLSMTEVLNGLHLITFSMLMRTQRLLLLSMQCCSEQMRRLPQ